MSLAGQNTVKDGSHFIDLAWPKKEYITFCIHPFATLAISCISGFARLCENRSIEHLDNRLVFQRFHDKSVSWVKALRYERYAMTVSVLATRPDAACCKGRTGLGSSPRPAFCLTRTNQTKTLACAIQL